MKVLVIGGGGREHALIWKLSQSKHVNKIYSSPGNAGIAEIAECVDLSPHNFGAIVDFVKYEWIDLTIVCTEKFLDEGIVSFFGREGCRIFGPDKMAAQVGSSRVFAKNLMRLYGIPTAEYKVFASYLHAQDYIRLKGTPIIIKTDGRLGERGAFLVSTTEEATDVLKMIMRDRIFGDAGKYVIIEERLNGRRLSFMALTDGMTVTPLTTFYTYGADETRQGATGMGAYSPAYRDKREIDAHIMEKIMEPLREAFQSEGINHKGFISADLVINDGKAYVCELNCCLRNLEAQTILPRLKADFVDILSAVAAERLSGAGIRVEENATASVVCGTEEYPKSGKDITITGLEKIGTMKDVIAFHENTSFSDSGVVTPGGKAICVTGIGKDLRDARTKAYQAVEKIHFEGMSYRKDIGDEDNNE